MPRRSAAPEIGLAPVPCARNAELERLIRRYAEVLREQAHTLGDHGLAEDDFYRSGVFRGAIERLRGQFSATMREKRDFVRRVLARLEDDGHIAEWNREALAMRLDYTPTEKQIERGLSDERYWVRKAWQKRAKIEEERVRAKKMQEAREAEVQKLFDDGVAF